jgi:hypothetical protein
MAACDPSIQTIRAAIWRCRLELRFNGKVADQARQDTAKKSGFWFMGIVLELAFIAAIWLAKPSPRDRWC